ncbi:hypothetical protein [Schumannella luteola]|jgi:hypothetical protein
MTGRELGERFLQKEIDTNRRAERWLVLKAAIALAVVGILVVVRQVFFV